MDRKLPEPRALWPAVAVWVTVLYGAHGAQAFEWTDDQLAAVGFELLYPLWWWRLAFCTTAAVSAFQLVWWRRPLPPLWSSAVWLGLVTLTSTASAANRADLIPGSWWVGEIASVALWLSVVAIVFGALRYRAVAADDDDVDDVG